MQKEELTRDPNQTNPLVLAFLGDATYAHCVRYHLIAKGLVKPNQLHKTANRYVSAKAQANILLTLLPTLPEDEVNVVKRGRNAKSGSTAKNADIIDYRHATAFEALIGYLYLNGKEERIAEIMQQAFAIVEGE
ncbi:MULTISPECIES: Mini-ribonuclease 3 [Brevibacillus]|uniref:Mini-ribonuclease 3 n=2 Tax=Brevibacillus TaxID=55080 RepID=A0A1I4DWT3_9BACL|nr:MULTISPECIES: ribonuclease III domain-containing protein [Brevibacillus]KQL47094.1 ribonuclease III [Brevibacillus choshinensis]MDR7318505.1 ribonuclease-3 family protein [Brevibacillus nitrificans]MEC2131965.1 ribonuclease III domain-containing protein [Brevibacillus centrosporus]MED4912039.1 ribonuclease III domain-containing protein [Brevibacillus centrosporus]RNB66023.1 ribonuclease III [Brevibacillus centrosporus]